MEYQIVTQKQIGIRSNSVVFARLLIVRNQRRYEIYIKQYGTNEDNFGWSLEELQTFQNELVKFQYECEHGK